MVLLSPFFLIGCSPENRSRFESFGAMISPDEAIPAGRFISDLNGEDTVRVKLKAEIDQVCQVKGCWMTLKSMEGSRVRVTFKDYGFFVSKNVSGRLAIIEGIATRSVLASDTARHYAEDAGQEYDEATASEEISIVASGVLIEKEQERH